MPDISKITLPSGNTYDIKDAVARQMISGGVSFNIVWTATDYASTTAPSSAKLSTIPKDVVVYYNNGASSATGTLVASEDTVGEFYLIYSKTQTGGLDVFDEYATIGGGPYVWEKIGDTQIDLSNIVTDVTLNKQTTNFVTGYSSPSTDTFVKSVSAETNKNLVTTSITPAGTSTSVVNSVSDTTSKLVTTSIPNVTSAGSASSWNFAMGTGTGNTETLVISGSNGSAPTLGNAITAATGSLSDSGSGASVMTGTSTGTTSVATVGTAVTVATGATSTTGTGDAVVTGVTIGSSASAITALGTPSTTAGLNNSTSLTVTKGS